MRETGIVQREMKMSFNYEMPTKCRDEKSKISKSKSTLSLKNLAAAFVLLVAGYVSAMIAFIFENLYFKLHFKRKSLFKNWANSQIVID